MYVLLLRPPPPLGLEIYEHHADIIYYIYITIVELHKLLWFWPHPTLTLYQLYLVTWGAAHAKKTTLTWKFSCAQPRWLYVNVFMIIQLYSLFPSFNVITKYITGNHMLKSSYIFLGFISLMFVSNVYGLIQLIYAWYFSEHTVMCPCYWSNTVFSKMCPYMVFCIFLQHDYWEWLYLQLYSRGQLVCYFRGYYIYVFASAFVDVLISESTICLLGELYHG